MFLLLVIHALRDSFPLLLRAFGDVLLRQRLSHSRAVSHLPRLLFPPFLRLSLVVIQHQEEMDQFGENTDGFDFLLRVFVLCRFVVDCVGAGFGSGSRWILQRPGLYLAETHDLLPSMARRQKWVMTDDND